MPLLTIEGKYKIVASGCWEWQGGRNSYGYGLIGRKRAHRCVWEELHGKLEWYEIVMHKCDNPPCVNPEHLKNGTKLENNWDAIAKGRNQHGETHGCAKLSFAQVLEIRADRAYTHKGLAKLYGVNQSTITRIKSGARRSQEINEHLGDSSAV